MKLIDMHCDTAMKLLRQPEMDLCNPSLEVNLPALIQAHSMVEFFACFTDFQSYAAPPIQAYDYGYQNVLDMIQRMNLETERYSDQIALASNLTQIRKNDYVNKISAFLTVEEGGILNGKMERLYHLYQQGIRLITLTWNYENSLGFPNSSHPETMSRGLKPFGFEVIEEMNRLGIIIDVSHLSDGGFWDVLEHSKKPVVASHSCVRELCNHSRNLSQEMIRAIGNQGGVIGVNFYGGFLHPDGVSTAQRIAQHIRMIADISGIETAAIGSDLDGGISANPLEIHTISRIDLLYDQLQKAHFSADQIDKIFFENALRVIGETTV